MKFMMIVKASKESEAGVMPSNEDLSMMAKYNEKLVKAGVMLDGTGLHPTSKGWKVQFDGKSKRAIVDGPFAEAKECIAGYWVIQTKTREEAIEWSRQIPFEEGEVEVRQLFEMDDFPPGPGVEEHKKLQREMLTNKH